MVRQDAYVLRKLEIDSLGIGTVARLRLGQLELDNASKTPNALEDFGDRLVRARSVHDRATEFPSPLSDLLLQHRGVAIATTPVPAEAERLVPVHHPHHAALDGPRPFRLAELLAVAM